MNNSWPVRKVGDITRSLNAKRVPLSSLERQKRQGSFPYYGASGVVDHIDDYIFDGTYLLVSEDGENLRTRKTPIAFKASGRYWVNNHAHILDETEEGILDFLEHAFRQLDISPYITGAVQPKLNKRSLEQVELQVPELEERLRINHLLGSLEDKIELNRRMSETLEEMARALFRDWFVDFGPTRRQMDGATDPIAIMGNAFPAEKAPELAPLFPAKLDDAGLPEGWTKRPVGELAEIVGGGTPSTKTADYWENGSHLWATPRDLSKLPGVFIGETERHLTDAGLAKVSSGLSPKGSVLMSSRAPIGYLAVASEPIAVNQGFIVLRPSKEFPTYFAKLWCEASMDTIEANANGSTFQEISKKNFKPILSVTPSSAVMGAFTFCASALFEKIEANERENHTLAETRDLLLPKLMSGEVRLAEVETAQ